MSLDQPVLQVAQVGKRFGGVRALSKVDLSLFPGQVHALIGPNGAGKSTLINVITGVYQPDGGHIYLNGERLDRLTTQQRVRRGVVRTFQEVRGFPELSVIENVLIGAHIHLPSGLFDLILRPHYVALRRDEVRREVETTMEMLGILEDCDVSLAVLPFGKQRLMGLVRAMAAKPAVVLLDEPGAGLRHDEMDQIIKAVDILRRSGAAILLVEHHMSMVEALADNVTVLDFGEVIAEGQWAIVREESRVVEAYLGTKR